ncbi:MAG: two-component system OmpR family sensor kinase, partial [Motiliproteus sp.]
QDRALKIETSLRRLSDLSEKLMQLAKAEGGGLLAAEPQDLTQLLRLVIDDLKRSAVAAPIRLALPENGGFISAIDPDAFAILVRNLLDNAIKHGAKHQPIEVDFSSQGVLVIVNAAKVIPDEILGQLRRRFVRSATTAPGSGLGLAIADAIVTGIGATLSLNSPATGRADGFEVRVDFPLIIGPALQKK